uniref:Protein Wnt n=1 Tax=Anopheles farauti TaxID=69004 RepID=A0A182QI97_9DIPT
MSKKSNISTKKITKMAASSGCSHSWITLLWIGTLILATSSSSGSTALGQGLPTWISLGIKSPFIVFRSEQEVLSNNSVLLNLTDIRNKLKSVHNLDHFIRPIDSSSDNKGGRKDHSTGKGGGGGGGHGRLGNVGSGLPPAAPPVFSAESAFGGGGGGNVSITFLTTVAPSFVNHFEKSGNPDPDGAVHGAVRPISSMRSKPPSPSVMGLADHMISDDEGGKKERKYIIPLALKTSTNEKEKTSSVFHGSSTNIDDLKRHILMLQNLTQSDKNFQSKFVVFPSLQKNGTATTGPLASSGATAPAPVLLTPGPVSARHLPMAAGSAPRDVKEYRNAAVVAARGGAGRKGETNTTNNRSAVRSQISSASINMPKKAFPDSHDILSDRKEGAASYRTEKITIVPQVFLQNDQTSETVSDKVESLHEHASRAGSTDSAKMTVVASQLETSASAFGRAREMKEKNVVRKFGHKSVTSAGGAEGNNTRNNHTGLTAPHMKPTPTATVVSRGNDFPISVGSVEVGGQPGGSTGHGGTRPNGTNIPGSKGAGKKKQRKNGKRRGGTKQTIKLNGAKEQPKTVILNDDPSVLLDGPDGRSASDANRGEPIGREQPGKVGRSTTGSRKRASSARVRRNDNGGSRQPPPPPPPPSLPLQPYAPGSGRLHTMSRTMVAGSPESLAVGGLRTTDPLTDEESGENNNRSHNYRNRTLSGDGSSEKDIVDLNPDLCYTLSALSGGQQKLCAQHTSIMPAISRGARAAIQECKHQFRNRRWNCSIVNDDTVFGPVSNIGSPEMAFVYAMAAAAASSFIARACRDGQLASCGCSRSSRPSKLNEDWTWGGCGDDMEYGYKFTQTFIDIREKEKKRGTRGLVSIPAKYPKIIERLLDALNDTTKAGVMLNETDTILRPEDLEKLQDKIAKEIANSNLNPKEISDLQERINKEITNSEVFNLKNVNIYDKLKKIFRKPEKTLNGVQFSASAKARALMNLHNNEAGRRAVIKKSRIICKCHGVSGSCSLITCWQQLTSIREIGDFLREKYDEATQVKVNKRGRLQVKDPRYKIPSALDLIYLDESPDWCRVNRQLMWQGTHGRVCNKTSSGLDGCSILCCGRGYNTKKIIVKERCNCKFQWCCQVKCEICTRSIEEYTCK